VILFFLACRTGAQVPAADLALIHAAETPSVSGSPSASYVFKDSHWLVKYNPLSLVFGGGLLFYQKVVSPQFMQGCAFEPSCSNFSKQCIHRFGILKGVALSTDRLTRCTRLSSIDFHPALFTADNKVKDVPEFYGLRR
jgi:uncharacterized protein